MKKFLLLAITLIYGTVCYAQGRTPQTLLGDGIEYTSGFGGFMLQFPTIENEVWSMTGGGGAVIINNQFYIGGYGFGLADDKEITVDTVDYDIDFGHGGLIMGYVIMPENMVHFVIESKVGWGEVTFREKPFNAASSTINDNMFILNPMASVEVNMTTWFKLNFGLGYQIANGVDNFYFESNDFDGMTYNLSLLFGWFR